MSISDTGPGLIDTAIAKELATGVETAVETASPDTGGGCPSAPGCSCKENGDCDNAQCIDNGNGKVCATPCVTKCEDGFKCALINGAGGDSVTICVPKFIRLCDPCVKSKDCQTLGNGDAACVAEGGPGNFCGAACTIDTDCAAGYACQSVTSVEGAPSKQCVKASTAPELKYGECVCSASAIAQKAQTSCFVEHKNDKGELVGKCAGVRSCAASGLTTCAAPALDVEVCDGKDNDCDGLTDENTCDAGGACNVGTCDPLAGCQYSKLNNVPCDADKNACTDNDQCKQGVCVPGPGKVCDDGNPCTSDSCDPASGCTKTVDDGKLCDADGNACTAADHCVGATCTPGKVVVCDNTNPCSKASCDVISGKCVGKAVQDGVPCDDGTACTQSDHCQVGECLGKIISCDDNNPCTGNSCDPITGCASTNLDGSACDDDNPCTIGDLCKVGVCVTGAAKVCNSGIACTAGSCDLVTGKCAYKNKVPGAPCDDGDACSAKDACENGVCQGKAVDCDDANPCTDDNCDNKLGCLHKVNSSPCSDGDACTASDGCVDSKCVPGVVKVCADNVFCTVDSCNKTSGNCVFDADAANGTPCDDNNVCTLGDNCKGGFCAVGIAKDCNDNNPCTDDLCDKTKGCSPSFNSKACDDSNACTSSDICKFGDCEGNAVNCNDNNPCTDDSCDAKKGCVNGANSAICNDNNACTTGDSCKNTICGGAPAVCDDGNVCSDDSCDKVAGCVGSPNVLACPDNDACTTAEKCKNLNCVKQATNCDDSNECTIDSCDAVKGCIGKPVVDKTLCGGGALWCVLGKCQAKQACGNSLQEGTEECDDGNLIDNDACSNACKNNPINAVFSTCTAVGMNGPTQNQCDGAYAGTILAGKVTVNTGIQTWTVPKTGVYRIEAVGAHGGSSKTQQLATGHGAKIAGDVQLNQGDVLKIIVGQLGLDQECQNGGNYCGGGGGGGSFVTKADNTPLMIAGGGGGAGYAFTTAMDGQAGTGGGSSGNNGGGVNGQGGATNTGDAYGSGGGGLLGNGANGFGGKSNGGKAFINGGAGGIGYNAGNGGMISTGHGGFGGGGGVGSDNITRAGGGGGYSGGQGGNCCGGTSGGGGGSFNAGVNPSNVAGANNGVGSVTIKLL